MKNKIYINGMMCKNCEKRVEEALMMLSGMKYVHADVKNKCADVEYDENLLKIENIEEQIKWIGYEIQ